MTKSSMKSAREEMFNILVENRFALFAIFITMFAVLARLSEFNIVSGDMNIYLLPWSKEFKENGFLYCMRNGVKGSNYPPAYMLILGLLSLLPLKTVYAIKIVSILFDFVCAFVAFLIAGEFKKGAVPYIVYCAVLLSPTAMLNSARWGQCDSIYTAFILLSVYSFVQKKRILPGIFAGVALAFKIQTVFFLPAFFFIYFKREKSFLAPVGFLSLGFILGNIIPVFLGSPISNMFTAYISQTFSSGENSLTVGTFPNLYFHIYGVSDLSTSLVFFAFGVVLLIFFVLWEKLKFEPQVQNHSILILTMLFLLIVPYVLPHMHERYYYTADIFSIIFGAVFIRYAAVPVVVTLLSLLSYFPYLFGKTPFDTSWLGLIMLALIAILFRGMLKGHFYPEKKQEEPEIPEVYKQ